MLGFEGIGFCEVFFFFLYNSFVFVVLVILHHKVGSL